ncbi:type II secretion system minor pseudopilin GspI [Permianibacter sp. IMCC34836]|uniref:type II secretion system minor pseudopilin GspI n=1 Tax=Permianibacter fluminis TaxID=2738515 RepID=UPI001551F7D2|nr:type II secretion system minor pseudopilin GspI [Permianibacter fluminis]NQD35667.1 type II secretion system minor pseudopilin GspI [Permianibacter fluminis]
MPANKSPRGFTLLEVLVALAVFAITAAAMINGIATSISAQSYLERKTIAHWVAMNQLAETRLMTTWPAVGISDGSEEMSGHEWFWTRKVEETSDPKLRRVDIEVRAEREDESPLTQLAGFVNDRPELLAAPTGDLSSGGYSDGGKGESENDDNGGVDGGEPPPDGPEDPAGNIK